MVDALLSALAARLVMNDAMRIGVVRDWLLAPRIEITRLFGRKLADRTISLPR